MRTTRGDTPTRPDRLLTVQQTAERLNTTVGHVRQLVFRRELGHEHVGRLVRVSERAIEEYRARNSVEPVR